MNDYRPEIIGNRVVVLIVLLFTIIFLSSAEASDPLMPDENYSVQVASYRNIDGVNALVVLLKKQGCDAFFKKADIPGKGTLLRVCVGKYSSRDDASKAGELLRENGVIKHFLVVRLEPEYRAPVVGKENADLNGAQGSPARWKKKISLPPSSAPDGPVSPASEVIGGDYSQEGGDDDVGAAGRKLYDSALKDFMSGRYEAALAKFEEITKAGKNENAFRYSADCHYFLGKNGDSQHLSEGIDRYRYVVQNYPGQNDKNAQATYRLAESYRRSNLNYEALGEFKKICSDYPESEYVPQSLYMTGAISYEIKKFPDAIEKFKEYIKKFPQGERIRDAYFGVGDAYSQMRQFDDADAWYGKALEKWPALEDIPEDALLKMGRHYFETGRYDMALDALFVYLNLFPESDNAGEVTHSIALSFEKSGQLKSALKMFGLVLSRYPGSREAQKSELSIASIGIDDPGLDVPAHIFSVLESYQKPIDAYGAMAAKVSDPTGSEEVLLQKSEALMKKGRYRESFETALVLIENFPRGKYREDSEKQLICGAKSLINEYFVKGDHASVVDIYFKVDRAIFLGSGDFDVLSQIGGSLKASGLLNDAAQLFEGMAGVFGNDQRGPGLQLEMARIDCRRGRKEDAKNILEPLIVGGPGVDAKTSVTAKRLMGDICSQEGLYLEAAGFYFSTLDSKNDPEEDLLAREKYADALKGMGMYDAAIVNYKRTLNGSDVVSDRTPVPVARTSYEGMGDCLYHKGRYRDAIGMYQNSIKVVPEGESSRWPVFNIKRIYAKMGKVAEAAQLSGLPEGNLDDKFWTRVLDYYRVDGDWSEKNGGYVQES